MVNVKFAKNILMRMMSKKFVSLMTVITSSKFYWSMEFAQPVPLDPILIQKKEFALTAIFISMSTRKELNVLTLNVIVQFNS
jgi:hypothetical protein